MWTLKAMEKLSECGIKVRNQSVLIDGVNNKESVLKKTMRQLAYLLIEPYYVYLHDMVPGCEHLRTTLSMAEDLSLKLQGSMTGFNTPRVVCDAPGGGGKRDVSSYISYDQAIGISAWTSPSAKPGEVFYYFDPIHKLTKENQIKWKNSKLMEEQINDFKQSCIEKIQTNLH
jgi:lysine 2,3-aminomutase